MRYCMRELSQVQVPCKYSAKGQKTKQQKNPTTFLFPNLTQLYIVKRQRKEPVEQNTETKGSVAGLPDSNPFSTTN